jgi:hypothetical protein
LPFSNNNNNNIFTVVDVNLYNIMYIKRQKTGRNNNGKKTRAAASVKEKINTPTRAAAFIYLLFFLFCLHGYNNNCYGNLLIHSYKNYHARKPAPDTSLSAGRGVFARRVPYTPPKDKRRRARSAHTHDP